MLRDEANDKRIQENPKKKKKKFSYVPPLSVGWFNVSTSIIYSFKI